MNINITYLIVFILLVVLSMSIYRYFLFRAIKSVVQTFKDNKALSAYEAKTRAELGLAPKNIMEKIFTWRDYRENALTMLIKLEIVRPTRGEKLYLSEKQLSSSDIMEKIEPKA